MGKRRRNRRKLNQLAILVSMVGCLSSCLNRNGDDEIFIIPNGYEGAVYIIYNQNDGESPKYENGKRLYEISDDGVLRTQFTLNEKLHNIPKLYYQDNKKRVEIPFELLGADVKKNEKIQGCCLSTGNFYMDNDETGTAYTVFYVGTEKVIDSSYNSKIDLSRFIKKEKSE